MTADAAGLTTAGSSCAPTSSHSTTVSTPSALRHVCVTGKYSVVKGAAGARTRRENW